jgi:hypothetical protein
VEGIAGSTEETEEEDNEKKAVALKLVLFPSSSAGVRVCLFDCLAGGGCCCCSI